MPKTQNLNFICPNHRSLLSNHQRKVISNIGVMIILQIFIKKAVENIWFDRFFDITILDFTWL
jgi:hypothetical protein